MDYLSIIRKPIEGEMNNFVELFNQSLSQGEGLLEQVLSHILHYQRCMQEYVKDYFQ